MDWLKKLGNTGASGRMRGKVGTLCKVEKIKKVVYRQTVYYFFVSWFVS